MDTSVQSSAPAIRQFDGELIRVITSKAGSQWGIFEFRHIENQKQVTCIGVLYPHVIGSIFNLKGEFKWNDRFGKWQFQVTSFTLSDKISNAGIINYLSREGPNIGEKRAEELLSIFGKETIKVLREQPHLVAAKVSGFTLERAKAVSEWLQKEQRMFAAKESLYAVGLTTHQIGKIIAFFGVETPQKIHKECFELTRIDGIGFLTAAKIADKIGIPGNDVGRIRAGIHYALEEIMDEGHVCASHNDLIRESCKLLNLHKELIIKELNYLLENKKLLRDGTDPKPFSTHKELFKELANGNGRIPEPGPCN